MSQLVENSVLNSGQELSSEIPGEPTTDPLLTLTKHLEAHGIRYCMLARIQEHDKNRVTIAVHRRDRWKLRPLFGSFRVGNHRTIRCCSVGYKADRYDLASIHEQLRLLEITVVVEYWQTGLRVFTSDSVIARRQRQGDFWMAAADDEFRFLLAELAGETRLAVQHRVRILVEQMGELRAIKVASEFLGPEKALRVVVACREGGAADLVPEYRDRVCLRALAHPWQLSRYIAGNSLRRFGIWRNPPGLFVVMLGPDGVGKSTTRRALTEFLQPIFQSHGAWHFRPRVIGRVGPGRPVSQPHSMAPRGPVMSVLYLFTLVLDCWLGYLLFIRPLLVRSSLVILDRYFYDLLVDSKRYRYGGPKLLAWYLRHFVPPKKFLFLVLDADERVIYSRKRELSFEELIWQRKAYSLWTQQHSNSLCVRTDSAVEQVVAEVGGGILQYMAEQFAMRSRRSKLQVEENVNLQCSPEA